MKGFRKAAFLDAEKIQNFLQRLSWEDIRRFSWVGKVFLVLLLAYILSGILAQYARVQLAPQTFELPFSKEAAEERIIQRGEFSSILDKNIFNPGAEVPKELLTPVGAPAFDKASAQPTKLPLELVGTVRFVKKELSLASIKDKGTGQTAVYRVNDEVPGGVSVFDIERKKVYLRNLQSEQLEFIAIEEPEIQIQKAALIPTPGPAEAGQIRKVSPGRFIVSHGAIDQAMANLSQVLTEARMIPNVDEGGKIDGFKVFEIKPGSIYEKLGLQDGDILKSVNNVVLNDPSKALNLFNQLRSESDITINFVREGNRLSYRYNVR